LIEASQENAPVPLTAGIQQRDFTFVAEVAEALVRLGECQTTPGEILNVATGRLLTVRQFVTTAAELLQIRTERLKFGQIPNRPEEMAHGAVTVRRLKTVLGWIPSVEVRDGIQETVTFLRSHAGRGKVL
jgi:nucleoside-diphosphate-sugar epimerase